MERRYEVTITHGAASDLRNVYRYIAYSLKERATAKKWLALMKKEIASLSHMPQRIKLMDDEPWHSRGFRKFIVGNYVVIFIIKEPNTVDILWVCYGGMDIDATLQQRHFSGQIPS